MSREYDLYLQEHRANVKKGLDWLREHLPDVLEPVDKSVDLEWQIGMAHDQSKFDPEEYEAYDAYFYGGNRSYAVVQEFNHAWLRHIHLNKHHWQYWVLHCDDGEEDMKILDMPYHYILEMICDWWAFSWAKENLTEIFAWYDEHKNYIQLSHRTRKTVEDILERIRVELTVVDISSGELKHHGVKGQKWGVKNGPPYPLDKSGKRDNIVEKAVESGEIKKEINREKQLRHTKDGHTPGRSYLDGDLEYAQELVDKYSGKGETKLDRKGNWNHRERISVDHDVGVYVDEEGNETASNTCMIVYSNTGTHIYPARRRENK